MNEKNHTTQQKHIEILSDALTKIENDSTLMVYPRPSQLFKHQPKGHFHLGPECFLQLKGECEIIFPDDRVTIKPGNLLVLPPGLNHYEVAKDKNDFLNMILMISPEDVRLHFAHATSRDTFKSYDATYLKNTKSRFLFDIAENLVELFLEIDFPEKAQTLHCMAISFIGLMLDILRSSTASEESHHPKIDACIRYVSNHLTFTELSVSHIAKKIDCSSDYLSNIFHKTRGETISQFINKNRLRFAREMLASSELNISQIAYACGYRDPAYFSRIFAKTVGISPKKYRTQMHRDF